MSNPIDFSPKGGISSSIHDGYLLYLRPTKSLYNVCCDPLFCYNVLDIILPRISIFYSHRFGINRIPRWWFVFYPIYTKYCDVMLLTYYDGYSMFLCSVSPCLFVLCENAWDHIIECMVVLFCRVFSNLHWILLFLMFTFCFFIFPPRNWEICLTILMP